MVEIELGELTLALAGSMQSKKPGGKLAQVPRFFTVNHPLAGEPDVRYYVNLGGNPRSAPLWGTRHAFCAGEAGPAINVGAGGAPSWGVQPLSGGRPPGDGWPT